MQHLYVGEVLEGDGLRDKREHTGNHSLRSDHGGQSSEDEFRPEERRGNRVIEERRYVLGLAHKVRALANVVEEKGGQHEAEPRNLS
jgi:hypothetical protein